MSTFTEILTEMNRRAEEIIYREEYETLMDSCEEPLDKEIAKKLVSCAYTSGSYAGSHQADELIKYQKQLIEALKKHIELLKDLNH